ncbi:hypothetical protein [Halobacillus sp. H74]|uniref:hypothetical protein n=1 Tax=Halobacillus sp. H74 TaxID=3457436 RepID=UPI003FCCCE34
MNKKVSLMRIEERFDMQEGGERFEWQAGDGLISIYQAGEGEGTWIFLYIKCEGGGQATLQAFVCCRYPPSFKRFMG